MVVSEMDGKAIEGEHHSIADALAEHVQPT